MENYRKSWNQRQPELRRMLLGHQEHAKALAFFLSQHAWLHTASIAPNEPWSFEDELLNDMTEAKLRRIPKGCEQSVIWIIWHIARTEDVTMNLLLAGKPQVLHAQDWLRRMKIDIEHMGTAMDRPEVAMLSTRIDTDAVRAYRLAVGRETRQIVTRIAPEELKSKPEAGRLQQVIDVGAVSAAAHDLVETWAKWQKVRLLAMPATRHSYSHLNEALRLKHRRG